MKDKPMPIRNTTARWGLLAQTLHWVIVALLIAQFVLANIADSLPLGLEKLAVLARHKSIGITILMLAAVRLVWRWMNPTPALPPGLKPYERVAARLTHAALYVLLFAMPLSGWMMSSARNFPVSWFNLVQLPDLVQPSKPLYDLLHETHETLAVALIVVTAVHALAALKHHFYLKDDVLRRMLPFTK
jgi:cytochrome b561